MRGANKSSTRGVHAAMTNFYLTAVCDSLQLGENIRVFSNFACYFFFFQAFQALHFLPSDMCMYIEGKKLHMHEKTDARAGMRAEKYISMVGSAVGPKLLHTHECIRRSRIKKYRCTRIRAVVVEGGGGLTRELDRDRRRMTRKRKKIEEKSCNQCVLEGKKVKETCVNNSVAPGSIRV